MKSFKNVKYIVLALVLVLALTMTACSSEEKEVVATVGEVEISQSELNDILVERYGAETLNSLISEKLVELEIEKNNIEITDEEIDKEVEAIEEQYGGKEGLDAALEQSNMTLDKLKEEIVNKISLEKLLADDLEVTDEEITAYYEENKEQFTQGEEVDASHILVDSEELANEVKDKLDDGGDMEELAKEYSTDPGSKDKGGNLGFFGRGKMVPEFDKAAFSQK